MHARVGMMLAACGESAHGVATQRHLRNRLVPAGQPLIHVSSVQLESTLTCPKCGHQAIETMPTDACQFFYDCRGCGIRLKPLAGDCCVFCSYGSVPCPPIQGSANCCAQDRPR